MAHKHSDGSEEQRPRTPEEIAAIKEANRIAARSNIRNGQDDRRKQWEGPPDGIDQRIGSPSRRSVVSIFEREMLMGEQDGM